MSWLKNRAKSVVFGLAAFAFIGCNSEPLFVGSGDFLNTGRTLSHFTAIQVDPLNEDSAGPQYVVARDVNDDGLVDLVSAWNQTQPIQVHLQRRDARGAISFETVTLAGNVSVISVAGLAVTDFDLDGHQDVVVLVSEALLPGAGCLDGAAITDAASGGVLIVYLGPDDPDMVNQSLAWENVHIGVSFLVGTYTDIAIGDMDLDGDVDIVTGWNGCDRSEILVFTNLGQSQTQDGTWSVEAIPDEFAQGEVNDVALADVDGDGDLDVVATKPLAVSMNIRWYRNPVLPTPGANGICYREDGTWQVGTVGQIPSGADVISLGDIDRDGIVDIVVRSTNGQIIQWLKGPECPTTPTAPSLTDPFRNIPWQVYTLAEFKERTPEALALGDLNQDGTLEVVASAGGALIWFEPAVNRSVYDQWVEHLIIDEDTGTATSQVSATAAVPEAADPEMELVQSLPTTTTINSILIADINGDHSRDIIAPLDRADLSGLANDVLVWFRNTR
jgi:hypothetical protein